MLCPSVQVGFSSQSPAQLGPAHALWCSHHSQLPAELRVAVYSLLFPQNSAGWSVEHLSNLWVKEPNSWSDHFKLFFKVTLGPGILSNEVSISKGTSQSTRVLGHISLSAHGLSLSPPGTPPTLPLPPADLSESFETGMSLWKDWQNWHFRSEESFANRPGCFIYRLPLCYGR